MEVAVAGAVAVDLATKDDLQATHHQLLQRMAEKPFRDLRVIELSGNGAMPASGGDLYVDLGAPPAGRIWDLRRLNVDAGGPFTGSATTSCDLFSARPAPAGTASSPAQRFRNIIGAGANGAVAISSGTIFIRSQERLIVHFGGGSSAQGQQFNANATVVDIAYEDLGLYLGV